MCRKITIKKIGRFYGWVKNLLRLPSLNRTNFCIPIIIDRLTFAGEKETFLLTNIALPVLNILLGTGGRQPAAKCAKNAG